MKVIFTLFIILFSNNSEAELNLDVESSKYEAIQSASPVTAANFERCLKNSLLYPAKKKKFHRLISSMESHGPTLLLEIGNAGFGRYDYLVLSEKTYQNGTSNKKYRLNGRLSNKILSFQMGDDRDLSDPGSPGEMDGNCYFLTIIKEGKMRSVAVYGVPKSTKTGILIQEILPLSR